MPELRQICYARYLRSWLGPRLTTMLCYVIPVLWMTMLSCFPNKRLYGASCAFLGGKGRGYMLKVTCEGQLRGWGEVDVYD